MANIKMDFKDIINLVPDLNNRTYTAAKKAVRRTFKGSGKSGGVLRTARNSMRKRVIKSSKQTTLNKKSVNKRFQFRSWANPKAPLHGMRAEVLVSDWMESAGIFSPGSPKKVSTKKNRKYYKPKLTMLGQRMVKLDKKDFKPFKYRRNTKNRGKKSNKSNKKWNHIFKRAGDARLPFKQSERGRLRVMTGSMHDLFMKKSTIGKQAFQTTKEQIRRTLQHELDFAMGKIIKGRPKRRNNIAR